MSTNGSMTGAEIRALRDLTGMTGAEFGMLLGVHQSSIYRWEAKNNDRRKLAIEPLQLKIMGILKTELADRKAPARAALMALLRDAIENRSTLGGIHILLLLKFGVPPAFTAEIPPEKV